MGKKKKLTEKQKKARAAAQAKKFTVGKGLDLWAIGGPAGHYGLHYTKDSNIAWLNNSIPGAYTGIDFSGATPFEWKRLIKGYGGTFNRVLEKKAFKVFGVKAPRTKLETVGDLLDHLTYWGKTAFEVWENRTDSVAAHRQAYRTQFGVDLDAPTDLTAYQPMDMITEKIIPYILQKKVRKIFSKSGLKMKLPGMGG